MQRETPRRNPPAYVLTAQRNVSRGETALDGILGGWWGRSKGRGLY